MYVKCINNFLICKIGNDEILVDASYKIIVTFIWLRSNISVDTINRMNPIDWHLNTHSA